MINEGTLFKLFYILMFNTIHFASDATWPPDGIPTLQDDPGEQGHVKGVQLQPLMSVFVPSTPGAVVQVPVLNARLKKNTRTILICWSQKPINQHIKTPGSASVRNPYIRLWGWPDCKIIVFRLWDSEEPLGWQFDEAAESLQKDPQPKPIADDVYSIQLKVAQDGIITSKS